MSAKTVKSVMHACYRRFSMVVMVMAIVIASGHSLSAWAQTTLLPWGNLAGMRVSGEPVDFEAGFRLVHPNWTSFSSAVKYLQRPRYYQTGAQKVVETDIEGISFKVIVEDIGPGEAMLSLDLISKTNLDLTGAFFGIDLPDMEFSNGILELIHTGSTGQTRLTLSCPSMQCGPEYLRQTATGVTIASPQNNLEIRWNGPRTVLVRRDASSRPTSLNDPSVRQQILTNAPVAQRTGYQIYIELFAGSTIPGQTVSASMKITARPHPDSHPATLVLDATKPGRPFAGIGGNFRLQFPKTDPAVLQYNLDNLRVAWGRVDMPWAEWDSDEKADPLAIARAGKLNLQAANAMETARTLARRNIPVIISAWSPPQWARAPSQPPGLRGTVLNVNKLPRICASLASYLVFLKEYSGVEAAFFSFNEPETGVEVRQTALEHAHFIKLMGVELAKQGLTTKLMLGDTAHGTPAALDFIRPSLADSATHRYIGAAAFHTWRGCTAEILPEWANAARELGVPLLITESGPDAHLHEYPSVRLEPWFQLQEIELYLRCCALAQPATIMEWQLTTDYSVLAGGGVYGEPGSLKPTQRFWNLKQLGATPAGAFALPITVNRSDITCAAFGDLANGIYALHMVNMGAKRSTLITGLPDNLHALRRYTTDASRGMEDDGLVELRGGQAEFVLSPASYTTLLSVKAGNR